MNDHVISSSAGMLALPAIENISKRYGMTASAFAFTFRSVAMPHPHTEAEFVSCCLVAREHDLNPLTKELYFMRDKHGRIQAIVGVDGWIKKCNEHPQFDGMEFSDTRDKDGKIVSMTCSIYRKDRSRPTTITEYFAECVQSRKSDGPWQTHPSRQMRTRTLCQCARIAFGFAGIMEEDEFRQWQATATVIEAEPAKTISDDFIPEPDEKPDTNQAETVEPTQEQPDEIADSAGVLKKLEDDLSETSDPVERLEVWEGMSELIGRLSDEDQRAAEKIFEGRA